MTNLPRVLCIDADPGSERGLERVVASLCLPVAWLGDLADVSGVAEPLAPDVVLCVLPSTTHATEICRSLRRALPLPGIIALTHALEAVERAALLDAGADDCVARATPPVELHARVRALWRRGTLRERSDAVSCSTLRWGPVELDALTQRVTVFGQQLHLSPLELRLLGCLLTRAPEASAYEWLAREVFVPAPADPRNSLRVLIARLRRRLGGTALCLTACDASRLRVELRGEWQPAQPAGA